MKKILLPLCLLLLTATTLAGCSDKEEKPEYKTPEGLHVTTMDAYQGNYLYHPREDMITLIFYAEPSYILPLLHSNITIYPVSEPEVTFGKLTEDGFKSFYTAPIDLIYRYPLKLADCTNNNSFNIELNPLAKDGSYDCYFRIENSAQSIYYQTPVYRLTLTPNESKNGFYTTSIKELN